MNKAAELYNEFLNATGDSETAKKCVQVFLDETNKLLATEYNKHFAQWWFFRLGEIREDLNKI